jgi:DNA damage-inducible protein 1
MQITFTSHEKVETLEFEESTNIEYVEEIVYPILGITSSNKKQIKWFMNGQMLKISDKQMSLKMLNIQNGDLISIIEQQDENNDDDRSRPIPSQFGRNVRMRQNEPVWFDQMGFNEVLHYNPNPLMAVRVFRAHLEVLRELGFHNPELAQGIREASTDEQAADVLREFLLFQTVNISMKQIEEQDKDQLMESRLRTNANDAEALAYMEDKQNAELIDAQYRTMMSEYPETIFPVLMLYIDAKINNVHVQTFVDSGAQTSVMTLACAKKCGIDKLIDRRAAGKVVGVGSSVTLGKIYIVPIQIGDTFFPMSVTVMESMGDKNMEFLFGLDMLKRHRFCIDLAKGELTFHGNNGKISSTPFLHEKDLPQHKGGTQGYDPTKPASDKLEDDEEDEHLQKALADSSSAAHSTTAVEAQQTQLETSARMEVQAEMADVTMTDGSSSQATSTTAATGVDEFQAKVEYLIQMGYKRENVERILREVNGDVETALTCLMFEQ